MEIHKPHILDFESSKVLYEQLTIYLIDRILDLNGERGVVRIGLTGGNSSLPLYKNLSRNLSLPWGKVHFFQTDERYINPTNNQSNQYKIKQIFDKNFSQEVGELNFFDTLLPIKMTVKNYAEKLEDLDGKLFDINILSVGPDGHIGSLFPKGDYLKHQEEKVIETIAPPEFEVPKRVSLSIESMLDAEEIILLVIGENKSYIIEEMLKGSKRATDFPVKFLLAHPKLKIYHTIN